MVTIVILFRPACRYLRGAGKGLIGVGAKHRVSRIQVLLDARRGFHLRRIHTGVIGVFLKKRMELKTCSDVGKDCESTKTYFRIHVVFLGPWQSDSLT